MRATKHIAALLAALILTLSLTACGQTVAEDDPMNPAIPVADGAEIGEGSKTVNGMTADYDKDGVYWAFYINGVYAMTGIDATTSPTARSMPSGWRRRTERLAQGNRKTAPVGAVFFSCEMGGGIGWSGLRRITFPTREK